AHIEHGPVFNLVNDLISLNPVDLPPPGDVDAPIQSLRFTFDVARIFESGIERTPVNKGVTSCAPSPRMVEHKRDAALYLFFEFLQNIGRNLEKAAWYNRIAHKLGIASENILSHQRTAREFIDLLQLPLTRRPVLEHPCLFLHPAPPFL